ncbi:hypothetical protein JXL83_06715 [candidate division WOR-3 bacterium]|nr:hypothetical protein [candidate division WOR-3 bacterium]
MNDDYARHIQNFIELGLTEREAKVYLTLLTMKNFTPSELQHQVNITRTKIYEVLQKMVDRGICTEKLVGKKKYYEAVEPSVAFERVFEKYSRNCSDLLEKKIGIVKVLVEELTPVFNECKEIMNPLDFIEVIKDRKQNQKKYQMIIQESKNEALTFNKGPYVCDNPLLLTEQKQEESELLKRGGVCKNIYEKNEIETIDWLQNYVKDQVQSGQQARIVENLPIKMIVVDRLKVVFPLQQSLGKNNTITSVYIEHKELAEACKMLFENIWEKAEIFT